LEASAEGELPDSAKLDMRSVLIPLLRFSLTEYEPGDATEGERRVTIEQQPGSQYLFAAIRLQRRAAWPNLRWLGGNAKPEDMPNRMRQLAALLPPGGVLAALDHALRARAAMERLGPGETDNGEAADRLQQCVRACLEQGAGVGAKGKRGSSYQPSGAEAALYRALRPALISHFEELRLSLSEEDREHLIALITLAAFREWESSRKQLRSVYQKKFEEVVLRPQTIRFMSLETDFPATN
jgi:hypothetical protein